MNALPRQPGLFDTDRGSSHEETEAARARMRGMIGRLRATEAPPWTNQMGVILDDGAFQRAMQLVPAAEAQVLWAEFDAEMERLYAVWAAGQAALEG